MEPPRRRRKKNTGKTAAKVLLCIVLVLGLAFGGIYWYVGSIFNTGEMGSLAPPESGADALVPDELSGTMNILVLGIDSAPRTPSSATPSARRI